MNSIISYILRHLLFWLPDTIYLKLLYKIETGESLNLKHPVKFQEKIQYLKLYNRKPEFTMMVDKMAVKDYVASIIGKEYVIPTLGVWNSFEEIDFEKLPETFVLKTTHGGGSCGVVICKDKKTFNLRTAKRKLTKSLKSDIHRNYREWPYKNVPRRIIAERFIDVPWKDDLTDYKIFCFHGIPKYIQVIQDRNTEETIDFFDTSWFHQPFVGLTPNCKNALSIPEKPINLDLMLDIARKLAEHTSFVRVDLYNIEGRVYFGEITFFPASGFGKFTPNIWEQKLGSMLNIVNKASK